MALNVKAGQFSTGSVAGTISVTCGFQPDLVLLTFAANAANDIENNLFFSFGGFDANGNQFASINRATYNTADTINYRALSNDKCAAMILQSGSSHVLAHYLSFNSISATGFTLSLSSPLSTSRLVNYIAIAGVVEAKIGDLDSPLSPTTQNVACGFRPDTVFLISSAFDDYSPSTGVNVFNFIGMSDNSENQCCYSIVSNNGLSESAAKSRCSHQKIVDRISADGTITQSASITYTSSGFDLEWFGDTVTTNHKIPYIAIRGLESKLIFETTKNATGDKSTTGVGFSADGIIAIQPVSDTVNTTENGIICGLGFCSGTTEQNIISGSEVNGVATTVSNKYTDNDTFLGAYYNASWRTRAAISAIGSDGATLTYDQSDGTEYVFPMLFFTEWSGIPTLLTATTTNITLSSATLNGSLDDMGEESSLDLSFQWGETTSYGSETTPAKTLTAIGSVTANISGLDSNTTYHFRVKATNGTDTWYSDDATFDTLARVPAAESAAAGTVTTNSAVLAADVTSLGEESSLTGSFEWGETTSYGSETTPETLTATGVFDFSLTGLTPGTEYHFRAKLTDGVDSWYSDDATFETYLGEVDVGGEYKYFKADKIWKDVSGSWVPVVSIVKVGDDWVFNTA